MKCMYCGFLESKVIDSRPAEDGSSIRRRRECINCGRRFTTYENIEHTPLMVVKNDKTRQPFDRNKIKSGIIKSCEKRPVSIQMMDKLLNDIEKKIYNSYEQEIESSKIGELVMDALKAIDEVAYVRFASVYRQFRDVSTFVEFITEFEKKLEK